MSGKIWSLRFDPQAVDDLRALDPPIRRRVQTKLAWLAERLEEVRLEPLHADLAGLLKLRVGDWRVVMARYEERRLLVVHVVAHRSEVYKIARKRLRR